MQRNKKEEKSEKKKQKKKSLCVPLDKLQTVMDAFDDYHPIIQLGICTFFFVMNK